MSRMIYIVSATSIIDKEKTNDLGKIWEEIEPKLDSLDKETDPQLRQGKWRGLDVAINYHAKKQYDYSNKDVYCLEFILTKASASSTELNLRGYEDVLTLLENEFDREFKLETYNWYTGGDRTGANRSIGEVIEWRKKT